MFIGVNGKLGCIIGVVTEPSKTGSKYLDWEVDH